jgi:hypothetical protein
VALRLRTHHIIWLLKQQVSARRPVAFKYFRKLVGGLVEDVLLGLDYRGDATPWSVIFEAALVNLAFKGEDV